MILSISSLIDESKLLLGFNSSMIWIDVSIKFLSDKILDKYVSNIINVSDYYRY